MHAHDGVEYRQAVYEKAVQFRSALEQGGLQLQSFAKFPRASCGDTCEMLGQFLIDSNLGIWTYRTGIDSSNSSHAYLERNGLLLDITADQFDDVSTPVMLTEDQTWHRQFSLTAGSHAASLEWWTGHNRSDCAAALADYALLKQRAEGSL
ncbi:hypothetical protein SAMN05216276_10947 [Streptosporangium subroseum]|uniref:Uncharacterized protein n=1 Tax=Streptosporangium subroseum TaxID=106412 RepID=A0A239P7H0_9ACTN|nr:hypothetical protein [Streptosporangium subroseum]SNT62833.1 hypothetical protein SAMN05216276_10947 [Streptosporangium subroseum]